GLRSWQRSRRQGHALLPQRSRVGRPPDLRCQRCCTTRLCEDPQLCLLIANSSGMLRKYPSLPVFLQGIAGGVLSLGRCAYGFRFLVAARIWHHAVRGDGILGMTSRGPGRGARGLVAGTIACAAGLFTPLATHADTLEGALVEAYQNNPSLNSQRA